MLASRQLLAITLRAESITLASPHVESRRRRRTRPRLVSARPCITAECRTSVDHCDPSPMWHQGSDQYETIHQFLYRSNFTFRNIVFRAAKRTEVDIRKFRHKNLMQYRRRDAGRYNMAPSTQLSNVRRCLAHGKIRQHEGAFRGYKRR
jgi:hypothetical protein